MREQVAVSEPTLKPCTPLSRKAAPVLLMEEASGDSTLWEQPDPVQEISPVTGRPTLSLALADDAQTRLANETVTRYHYLHRPCDTRCSLLAYLVLLGSKPIGCLIFGRPEATRTGDWYGDVADKEKGRCRLSRWEVLNLARIWFDPNVQQGGFWHSPDYLPGFYDREGQWHSRLASTAIEMALNSVVIDYLISYCPVWISEPYQLAEVLSYCNPRYHRGALYQQAGFHLVRENRQGLQTYARTLRPLTQGEDAFVCFLAQTSPRSKRLRAQHKASLWRQQTLPLL